jgi:hypothetical protein
VTVTVGGVQRIQANTVTPVLRASLVSQDGEPVAAVGAVTCTITRADGTVVATGRATAAGVGLGAFTCALTTGEVTSLDVLTAVWSDGPTVRATTRHRIVGRHMFSIVAVKELGGLTQFSDTDLMDARDQIADLIEKHTKVCWVPTFDVETLTAKQSTYVVRRRAIRSVRFLTVNGATVSPANLEFETEGIIRNGYPGRVVIGFEHGHDTPTDLLEDAAVRATKHRLLAGRSALGDRVRSISDEQGTRTFGFAGRNHPTGIDDIDAVIIAHAHGGQGIG